MEIKSIVEDLDHCRKIRTTFVEQLLAVHLLVEHLSIADSIKSEII